MHNKGHLLEVKSFSTLTIILLAAFVVLLLPLPFILSQPAYSQLTTNAESQNLSSLLENLHKQEKVLSLNSSSFSSLLNFLKPEKEVSGHYSNPQFGITDIVFPDGWHGREIPSTAGLIVIMHPGVENRSSFAFSIPFSSSQPLMSLQVINNSQPAGLSSGEGNNLQALSPSKVCNPLIQNTTSVIDGKTFNVATLECPLSSVLRAAEQRIQSMGIVSSSSGNHSNFASSGAMSGMFKSLNPNAIMQAKVYEFKGPDKTFRLSLVVSNLFAASTTEKPDISKYGQLLDTTANTLKLG